MDIDEKEQSLTNKFLEHFNDKKSQIKSDKINILNEMTENISIIEKGDDLNEIIKSVRYILQHIENLEFDDSLEIGPYILNYALDFENVELAVNSIHVLGILVKNPNQKEFYEPIRQEFIDRAKKNSDIIKNYAQGPLTSQINDLIFSFIKFSEDMLEYSIEIQLIQIIIKDRPFYAANDNLEQTILHLYLIFYLARAEVNNEDILIEIYNKVSQAMRLQIPETYEICLNIYNEFFEYDIDNGKIEYYFDDFFKNYSSILSEHCNNLTPLLNILYNFSKMSFVYDFLNKYPIYDFILQYVQLTADEIEYNQDVKEKEVELSWEIISEFIYDDPDQIKFVISNKIADNAFQICEEGSIRMKCLVIKFLASFLLCTYDDEIFSYVKDKSLLENLLCLVEILPIKYSKYIIVSTCSFLYEKDIPFDIKLTLLDDANTSDAHSSLTSFNEMCNDDELCHEVTLILGYFDGQYDEDNFYTICQENE